MEPQSQKSFVETLKEFKNILLGLIIKVYTDHKNLVHESETKSSQAKSDALKIHPGRGWP